jgi:hypothetical protein
LRLSMQIRCNLPAFFCNWKLNNKIDKKQINTSTGV